MSEEIYAKLNLDAEDAGRSINDINKELRETNEALKEVAINGKNFDKLTKHVEKLKEEEISGHITLVKGERSKVATLASKVL